jgi:glycogen debranching enzyme
MLFLILMAEYVRWSADLELARKLRPNIDAALDWMDNYANADGDGYFDYAGKYENELVNQGGRPRGTPSSNADGSLPPIALCEVQAYAFRVGTRRRVFCGRSAIRTRSWTHGTGGPAITC